MKFIRFSLIVLCCVVPQGQLAAAQPETQEHAASATTKNPTTSGTNRSIEEYRAQIKKDQSRHGPYDPQLGEELLGLGLQYRNQGQYKEAAKALDQALHIKRVNEGVDNLSQLPVLEALIDVNNTAGNWEALDRNYDLLLQVSQRNLASDDPSILANIEKVAGWKFLAYKRHLLKKKPEIELNDLIKTFKTTARAIETRFGKNDLRLIEPLNNLGMAHYLMMQNIQNRALGEFQGDSSKERLERVCRPVMTLRGVVMVCGFEPVSNPNYYYSRQTSKNMSLSTEASTISSLLNRMIKIIKANPTLPPHDLALALVDIGDWYFLYKMQNAAMTSYKRAFELLKLDGSGIDGVEKVFGRPTRIPSFAGDSDLDEDMTPTDGQPFVKLSFDVNTNGRASNINVVKEVNTKNFMARKTAKTLVKSWLFRPRFENGKPVTAHNMVIQFSGDILRKHPTRVSGPRSVTGSRIWR